VFMNLAKYAPVSLGIDFPAAKITERFYFVVARKSKSASTYPDSSFRAAHCSSNNEGPPLEYSIEEQSGGGTSACDNRPLCERCIFFNCSALQAHRLNHNFN
jgi:hypothetical protein